MEFVRVKTHLQLASKSKDVNGRYFSKKWQWNVQRACKKKKWFIGGDINVAPTYWSMMFKSKIQRNNMVV